ncbi:hypothetical protein SK571_39565 [Lentzea sp. BCCO 10_0798]|uniref:Uncharacterized protein n=1 Tax=Lentzea kristufekii TaxID=3095430 RepID=A0ABU4U4S0_9PSEU|nr:hypothetical protein [Lentzea sp. BCCO 10_0798]MDX8055511.1 hypothetical protein [Lentzea sp. BCCO 10_0798]
MSTRLTTAVKSPWFLIVGGIVAILSLVAALTGSVPELSKSRTKATSLVAEPVNKQFVTDFALPLNAPIDQMPQTDAGFYCDTGMIEWLRRFGTEVPPYQRISIRSAAEDGSMLVVDNLRAVDVNRYEPQPVMHFQCPDGGNADAAVLELRLDRDRKAQELVADSPAGTRPFAFNLEPGEQGNLELRMTSDDTYSYSGRIVADVSAGTTKETVSLPLNGEDAGKFDRIGLGKYARLVVAPGRTKNQFQCVLYPVGFTKWHPTNESFDDLFDCSAEKVRSVLAEIGRSS